MVKVTLKPWEEVIVHEIIEYDLKELVKLKTLYMRPGQIAEPLLWAEGVVFSRTVMPPTDDVIRDQLKGIVHLSSVEYALMTKYRSTLGSGGKTIQVIDATSTPALKFLARALKK